MDKLSDIQLVQAHAGTLGFLAGEVVMFAIAAKALRRSRRDAKRAVLFASRVIDDAWDYLPGETKTKLMDEAAFFNISIKEDL